MRARPRPLVPGALVLLAALLAGNTTSAEPPPPWQHDTGG